MSAKQLFAPSGRTILACLLTCSPLALTPAAAQSKLVPAADADTAAGEIVVTARKRNESAIDVPIALSVFSADTLEKSNVKGLVDLQNSVPGLSYQEFGALQTYVSIRGVGGDARNIGLESGVTIAIDGVSAGRTNAFNMDLAQIAQVEVLRGPQGTLFGTNTIGGVINITTKKPGAETAASADLNYGNYGTVRTSASVSTPVSDTFFVGATVGSWNSKGYLYNTTKGTHVNGQNRLGGRLQARWVPTEQLEVYVTADKTRDRRQESLNQLIAPFIGYAATNVPRDRYTITSNSPSFDNRDMTGLNGTIDYALGGGFAVKSISAYRKVFTDVASDADTSPLSLGFSGPYTDDSRFFTQELRVVSPSDKPLRFVGGFYYAHQDSKAFRYLNSSGVITTLDGAVKTNTYAAYLNGDFDVTSFLTLNAGVRQNKEKKSGRFQQVRSNSAALSYNFPSIKRDDDGTSWTGSIKLKASAQLSTYITVSRGFKSGGFNFDSLGATGLTAAALSFRPESVTNYEAGVKTILFDRKLRFNVALFRMDYSDRQVLQYNDAGPGLPPFVTVTNAASSRSKGIEADANLTLPAGWALSGSFSYIHAKYRSFPNATAAGANYTGNVTERTPRYTGYIGVDNTTEIGDASRLIFHADASYNGKTYFDAANNPQNIQDPYWLINGRIGYERDLDGSRHTVGIFAYAQNLTNKTYFATRRQSLGANVGTYGTPRFYGLQLSYKY